MCAWLTNFQPPLVPPSPESVATAVDTSPAPVASVNVASTSSISGTGISPNTSTEDSTKDTEYSTDDQVLYLFMEQADCDDIDFSTFSGFEHDQSTIYNYYLFMHCQHASS